MIDYKEQPHLNPDGYYPMEGPAGAQGPAGPQGVAGPQGPTGPQGPRGVQGERGPRGPMGEIGPQGVQGPKGDRGDAGRNGEPGPVGPMGPRGFTGKDGNVTFEELTPEQVEQLRGETGPQGPQGERGPAGPEGPQGATGAQGPKGETGENGPQGPKGNTGDIGPQGPPGPVGPKGPEGKSGIGHAEEIGESSTWNSKTIVDYATHGKVKWVEHAVSQSAVEGTANGYAKDLVVHGLTVINYVNKDELKTPIQTTEKLEMQNPNGRIVYEKGGMHGDKLAPEMAAGTDYTLIYKVKLTRADISPHDTDKVEVIVEDFGTQQKTTYAGDFVDGTVKIHFKTLGVKPQKIYVKLYTTEFPDGAEQMAFTASEFMILKGDYSQKLAPRYFWDTRGVGDKLPDAGTGVKLRTLVLESRGKNLINPAEMINDKYLKKEPAGGDTIPVRWLQGEKGSCASFLVYCKQKHYTLSAKIKRQMENNVRIYVVGYHDNPTNGQDAKLSDIYCQDDSVTGSFFSRSFKVGSPDVNVLAIYIANLGRPSQSASQLRFEDVFEYVQLEEYATHTEYAPYKSIEKRLVIPRSLMSGDILRWDDHEGQYVIDNPESGLVPEATGLKDESFLHTFDERTYLYVKNKIVSAVEAKFPIKIEGEKYYTKDEWQFRGNDPGISEAMRNILSLPNGFVMQWKDISVTLNKNSITNRYHYFLGAKNIIYAQATPAYLGLNGQLENYYSRVLVQIDPREKNKIGLFLDGDYQTNEVPVNVRVLVISDNRDAEGN